MKGPFARFLAVIVLLVGALTALPETRTAHASSDTVTADFAVPVDDPLIKTKFGVYNSCIVPISQYNRDINLIKEINPESLRLDGVLGGASGVCPFTPVSGTAQNLLYDFTGPDALATLLDQRNVLPYWSYDYEPPPLQTPAGEWRSPPSDLNAWKQVLNTFASHYRQNNLPIGYQEIWNEPDYRTCWQVTDIALREGRTRPCGERRWSKSTRIQDSPLDGPAHAQ